MQRFRFLTMRVFALLVTLLLSEICCASSKEILQVFAITRHGDRAPIRTFPNLFQWQDLGELTGEGMYQMFEVGKFLRKKYVEDFNFLSSVYNRTEFYARSTEKDRTLMSAQSLLLGLFPPGSGPNRAAGTEFKEHNALPSGIQSVPVHSATKNVDFLLHGYKTCPRIKELRFTVKNSPEWKEKELETQEFRERISRAVGMTDQVISLGKIPSIYHALKAEMTHVKSELHDISAQDFDKIVELKDFSLHRKFCLREMGKLGTGVLLKHIVDTFRWRASSVNSTDFVKIEKSPAISGERNTKFRYYSAHDGTLLSLISAMGLKQNFAIPHYAAHLLFELYRKNNNSTEFHVAVLYNDAPLISECNPDCTLEEFSKFMEDGMMSFHECHRACSRNSNEIDFEDDDEDDASSTKPPQPIPKEILEQGQPPQEKLTKQEPNQEQNQQQENLKQDQPRQEKLANQKQQMRQHLKSAQKRHLRNPNHPKEILGQPPQEKPANQAKQNVKHDKQEAVEL